MKHAYASIIALLVAVAFMVIGNGILGTIVPLRAKAASFSPTEVGLLGSAYFGGMLAGAILATRLLQRFQHSRTIIASILLATIATLFLALHVKLWVWLLMRFVIGFAFAGLYAAVESWIQGKASDAIRGRVLSIYSVVQFAGWGVGNQLIGLGDPQSPAIFLWSAAFIGIAALPLLIRPLEPLPAPASARMDVMGMWKQSPIGFVGAFLIGLINGPFWTLAPVFASDKGLDLGQIGMFMTILTVGSAALQIPVGKISDGMDRRKLLVFMTLATAAMELALGLVQLSWSYPFFLATGFVLGGFVATQYYVVAAHANDRTDVRDATRIASVLLFLYCVGAMLGPTTASMLMEITGPTGLFVHNGVLHLALAAFVIYRIYRRPPPVRPIGSEGLAFRPQP